MANSPDAEPLETNLRRLIARDGPISVARLMGEAVQYYYAHRDPFGIGGDFITAPDISQMFGELLGLWAADAWTKLGRPAPFALIELGPGRGTLMADALRAAHRVAGFQEALDLHLVETSPRLRARQAEMLQGYRPHWHDQLDLLPDQPFILLANEFLDALPIRQFVRRNGRFHERLVGLGETGALTFGLSPTPIAIESLLDPIQQSAPEGAVVEVSPPARALIGEVAARLKARPGYALFIDYGPPRSGWGDSLQAVKGHAFTDPLQNLGEADLTAHVDFAALLGEAASQGVGGYGPISQGELLRRLGIELCAQGLKSKATPEQARHIDAALARLTGVEAMGTLFQAIALASPNLPPPAAF